ncbi:MAG: hypothetical protein WB997_17800, partial [Candidatus Acidiferrales bacterium]
MKPRAKSGENTARANSRALVVADHYTPFLRQREFHESGAKYRLFGGAAGPGKTKALLWEAIRQANRYAGVDTLLLRRTFPELESSLIAYFRRDVPRDLYRSFHDSKHLVTWHNGSTTRFGHCAHEDDIFQYQGAEYLFIGLDELTHFTLKQWQFLTSRNRCPVPGTFPNMAGASNPGNIGHAWVKALWIDKRPPAGMESGDQYDPRDYDFIRATVADNPIYADDREYRRTLDALPTHLRRAFLEGDWNVFAGQYFDVFDRERHVVRIGRGGAAPSFACHPERSEGSAFAAGEDRSRSFVANTAPLDDNVKTNIVPLEPWWPRWISIDWGFEHPSAVLWHAAAPSGAVITYREFVQNRLSPRMLAAAIAERSA